MNQNISRRLALPVLLAVVLLLAACQPAIPTTAPVGSMTAAPSQTPNEDAPIPTDQFVKIALVALEDNGASGALIGCGDSVILVDVMAIGSAEPLQAALEALLGIKEQTYGEAGLYNALYQADLVVESIELQGDAVTVALSGSLMLGGECDDPRVEAQLTETVLANTTAREALITLNGVVLKDALSLK